MKKESQTEKIKMTGDYSEEYSDFEAEWINQQSDKIEAHTSGSTGRPKSIRLPKEMMRESARRTIEFFNIDSSWWLISCISAKYIGGKMMAVRALESGAQFISLPPDNRPDLSLIKKIHGNCLVAVVPSQMWHILTLPFTGNEMQRLHFLVGGSPIPSELRSAIASKGLKAWETYGMTETASHIALRPVASESLPFRPLEGIAIGKSNIDTLEIFLPHREPIITNDLVEFTPEGGFFIPGRVDNVIITGGLKVIPESLENRLRPLLAKFTLERSNPIDVHSSSETVNISEIMVTSRPDNKWGEAVILLLEIEEPEHLLPNDMSAIVEGIERLIREDASSSSPKIKRHEIPKHIEIIPHLPRTENGKLRRRH